MPEENIEDNWYRFKKPKLNQNCFQEEVDEETESLKKEEKAKWFGFHIVGNPQYFMNHQFKTK